MKTILVPTDFSKPAKNAVDYAARLAKDLETSVLLFHTYHLPVTATEVPLMISSEELQRDNELALSKEANELSKKWGIEVNYKTRMGLASDEILDEAKNAGLIVMGMNGAGKVTRAVMGSIAVSMVRKSTIPVLVIPEEATYKKPDKIVFACDYDPKVDIQTLNVLKKIAETFQSTLYIVNVKDKKEVVTQEEKAIAVSIDKKLCDVQHVFYFPEKTDLVTGLDEFVNLKHADMLAIIPHRYNMMERLFHKSISKKMAYHTKIPLLALPDNHESVAAYFF
ncbi:MAG TPA: universal stress protein [Bacteroidia bacterium]|nr:universal stress protein [Bacteroidia bacterium]